MKLRALALAAGLAPVISSIGSAEPTPPKAPTPAPHVAALARTCQARTGVSAARFTVHVTSNKRRRAGWIVAIRAERATTRRAVASQIADAARAELRVVETKDVVGKYIGETEKNLMKLLEASEQTNVILFFDEADALFGKRTDVRDAHNRHGDEEASRLKQKLLEYDGLVVLGARKGTRVEGKGADRLADVVVTSRVRKRGAVPPIPWKELCWTPKPRRR